MNSFGFTDAVPEITCRALPAHPVTFHIKSTVAKGFDEFDWLSCWEWYTSVAFFALIPASLVKVICIYVLAVLFDKNDTSKSSGPIISARCTKLLSLSFRRRLVRGESFLTLFPGMYWIGDALSHTWKSTQPLPKNVCCESQRFPSVCTGSFRYSQNAA